MKSGVFGLRCPLTKKIVFVSSSERLETAMFKYQGQLKKKVGSSSLYLWLCGLQMEGQTAEQEILEYCPKEQFSEVKRKWVKTLKESGQAQFNVNFSK